MDGVSEKRSGIQRGVQGVRVQFVCLSTSCTRAISSAVTRSRRQRASRRVARCIHGSWLASSLCSMPSWRKALGSGTLGSSRCRLQAVHGERAEAGAHMRPQRCRGFVHEVAAHVDCRHARAWEYMQAFVPLLVSFSMHC